MECQAHGWQDTVIYTRYERREHPRDVPDRHVCELCAHLGLAPDETNSLRIGPATPEARLRDAMGELARHLRKWHEPGLAETVEGALEGEVGLLPRRAVALFSHGMGGLLDCPLYKRDGQVDQQATHRRDLLAERVHAAAVEALA